jgi:oligopeptide transport system substrate-binding protein
LKKLIYTTLAVILISILFLGGCFSNQPGSNASFSSGAGVLNLVDTDPFTLDPAMVNDVSAAGYVIQIFNGLLKLGDNLEPQPDIAADMPTLSQDGLTYTFHLRQDVIFQDGRAVKASDFKYSWERCVNPATGSPTAATYLGDIAGVKDEIAGKTNQISGVKVADDYTLQVTIDSPKSYFLFKLTYPPTFVVDNNNAGSGGEWWRKPNGTGPFKVKEWIKDTDMILVRNDAYYGEKPQLRQINFQYNNTTGGMDLYETGKIDITGTYAAYYDKIMDRSEPFYKDLSIAPNLSLDYIGFNCAQPPFDDINIRKAFSLAIDKDKIISLIYRDMVKKAGGILPPGMPGYNSNLVGLGYDFNQAKALISASKYGDVSRLPPITLTISGRGGGAGNLLESLGYQWKHNLGVDIKIRQLEPEEYINNLRREADQMFYFGWIADYPHPQDFVDILFRSGSDYNYGQYSNTSVDELIRQANQTLDQEQSYKLYQQAEQKIIDDAGCMPLDYGETYTLVKPYVQGFSVNPLGFVDYSRILVLSH